MNNNIKKEKRQKEYFRILHMNMMYFSSIGYNHNFDYKHFKQIQIKVNNKKILNTQKISEK
tara:strand:+ start:6720 stop:6902 length:183 start_codon:yes stop_codon:yes gene_type:complete